MTTGKTDDKAVPHASDSGNEKNQSRRLQIMEMNVNRENSENANNANRENSVANRESNARQSQRRRIMEVNANQESNAQQSMIKLPSVTRKGQETFTDVERDISKMQALDESMADRDEEPKRYSKARSPYGKGYRKMERLQDRIVNGSEPQSGVERSKME